MATHDPQRSSRMIAVLRDELERWRPGGEPAERLPEWPACLELLTPVALRPGEELPACIADALEAHGDTGPEAARLPVKLVSVLGRCHTHFFITCPNVPEHRTWDAISEVVDADEGEQAELLEKMLRYTDGSAFYWLDLDVTDAEGAVTPLRVAYNLGDADANEGYWGAAWHRETRERLADILSTGDGETTLRASPRWIERHAPHERWLPVEFDLEKYNDMLVGGVIYAADHELEKLLHLGLLIAADRKA